MSEGCSICGRRAVAKCPLTEMSYCERHYREAHPAHPASDLVVHAEVAT